MKRLLIVCLLLCSLSFAQKLKPQPYPGVTGDNAAGISVKGAMQATSVAAVSGTETHSALRAYRAAVASGTARVAIIGDSVCEGYVATNQRVNGWCYLLASRLQVAYGNGGEGFLYAQRSDRFTTAGSWSNWGTGPLAGTGMYTSSANATISLTATATSFDIYGQFGASTARYSIDGGGYQSVTISSGTNYHAVVSAGSLGQHTITLIADANNNNSVYLSGIRPLIGSTGVVVDNLSRQGKASGDYVSAKLQPLIGLAPHLVIVSLGINDAGGGVDVPTYTANLTNIVQYAQSLGAGVLIVSENPIGANDPPFAAMVAAAKQVAANTGADYLSVYDRWGSYAAALAQGLMAPTLHPTTAGHADIAAMAIKHLVPLDTQAKSYSFSWTGLSAALPQTTLLVPSQAGQWTFKAYCWMTTATGTGNLTTYWYAHNGAWQDQSAWGTLNTAGNNRVFTVATFHSDANKPIIFQVSGTPTGTYAYNCDVSLTPQ